MSKQRRKGNAKNASSASAHEYLAQGGETFVGLTPEMNIFEMASTNRLHHVSGIDDETRIVMKKLTKKDCQTREKGLKELMNLITMTETSSRESCYEHFCGLVAQLSTDGSPSVRLLTMKAISSFLVQLKKNARKGLKKIVPMVLFARSDVTNGVAAAATAVIRDCFDVEKKQQVLNVFAPFTFEMAASIVQGKHDLSAPIEYDASEDKEARMSRLETQSLNVFLSYTKEFGSESNIWEGHARKLFENTEFVKKVFAGKKESLKVQLLNLSYRFQNNIEVMLSVPAIVPYIQNNLDAQTFTPECATAWEGITLLLPCDQFQSKVSLQKGMYPRLLNVIRKKGNHWRILKHYLLPSIIVLLQELKTQENDLKPLKSIMDSFIDNLPWPTESSLNAIHSWFYTFSDFVRWILSNDRINLVIWETISPLVIKFTEQAMIFPTNETTECVTELLHWIIDQKIIGELELKVLFESIECFIVNMGKEKSRLFRSSLTKPGKHLEVSELHAHLISTSELVDFAVVQNLARSDQSYFDSTTSKITDFSYIENTEQFDGSQAEDVVQLLSLISNDHNTESLRINARNDHVGRGLLLSGNQKIWDRYLKQAPVSIFQEMINHWHEKRNGKAIAEAVSFLRCKGVEVDTNQAAENVDFLVNLLNKITTDDEKSALILKLFTAIFESDEAPKAEHYQHLQKYLNLEFNPGSFFDNLFRSGVENDIDRIFDISSRFDKLIDLYENDAKEQIIKTLVLSGEKCRAIISRLQFLELEVLACSQKVRIISSIRRNAFHLDEHAAKQTVTESARIALFYLSSKYHTSVHQVFGSEILSAMVSLERRYCLNYLNDELKNLKEEIGKRLVKLDPISEILDDGCLSTFYADADLSFDQNNKSVLSETKKSDLPKTVLDIFNSYDQTPLHFMKNVFECSQSETSCQLFHFDRTNEFCWMSNILFVKKFIQCGANIFEADFSELRDFALCGMVTVLDESTDILTEFPHAFEEDVRLEALTTMYMELFLVLSESIEDGKQSSLTVQEWEEFYVPTINSFFIRMFRVIRKDQQPTPFVRALLSAIFTLKKFPTNIPSDNAATREFIPELSIFKYSPFEESCISQAFGLFSSDVEHVQLIGYAVSKLLMPLMFKTENPHAFTQQDDTEVVISQRRELVLPFMISKSYPTDHVHKHVGPLLLDLAMLPLQTAELNFRQEQRVAYCDAIDNFVKNALNALMLDQPFEFHQVPITCRIPKLREREYYLHSDMTASPTFFDKFASRLLFKSITLLPAAVRMFHKNMPNCFMPVFHEVITKYASKLLIETQLDKVNEAEFGDRMKVRTVPVTGQIIAEYAVEETKMKLTIELPADYPLSVPTMNLDKAIVRGDRAKKWLMQLNAYLFHQNGAILEGIEMWKRNVDKGIEGVEDCTICMMTVHQQTHQLPKIKCKQCKNKFHSNCLYKWFESSNQSTCPLCRNNFT